MAEKIIYRKKISKIFKLFKKFKPRVEKYCQLGLDCLVNTSRVVYLQVKKEKLYGFLIIIVFIIIWLLINFATACLVTLFLVFLCYKWDRRILLAPALILLISCPIFLHLKQDNYAILAAVYAYYLLLMIFTLLVFDFRGYNLFNKIKKWLKKLKASFFS
ncbi:MAG: hypothetical protein NTZ49_00050 [Candidatus Parcubacteria bacterium]|nr:hypothetical protein [Candidatus Parcubacteria bacterium]